MAALQGVWRKFTVSRLYKFFIHSLSDIVLYLSAALSVCKLSLNGRIEENQCSESGEAEVQPEQPCAKTKAARR